MPWSRSACLRSPPSFRSIGTSRCRREEGAAGRGVMRGPPRLRAELQQFGAQQFGARQGRRRSAAPPAGRMQRASSRYQAPGRISSRGGQERDVGRALSPAQPRPMIKTVKEIHCHQHTDATAGPHTTPTQSCRWRFARPAPLSTPPPPPPRVTQRSYFSIARCRA